MPQLRRPPVGGAAGHEPRQAGFEDGERRWVGISRSGDRAKRWYLRGDLDSFGLEARRLFDEKLRLVHVEMP